MSLSSASLAMSIPDYGLRDVPCRGLPSLLDDISEDHVAYSHRRHEDRGQGKVECDELRHGVLLT